MIPAFFRIKSALTGKKTVNSHKINVRMTRVANPKVAARLFPRRGRRERIDTADRETGGRKAQSVLMDAFNAWTGLDRFREKAHRNRQYTFEDQWGDRIRVDCKWMTERESILAQGNVPLANNRIRGIVRSVLGVFQSAQADPVCSTPDRDETRKGELMSAAIRYVYRLNRLSGLDSVNFQYFLITGLAAYRSTFGWRQDKMDVWTDVVNYNNIFFDNHMYDTRHWDCHLIGELHDVGLYDLMAQFAEGSPEKAEKLKNLYGHADAQTVAFSESNLTESIKFRKEFFTAEDPSRCRIIEVWTKESRERLLVHDSLTGDFYKVETGERNALEAENAARVISQGAAGVAPEDMKLIEYEWFIDSYWYYRFLTPWGDVLKEGESPYWHKSHPYSFRVYPFFDGQVFPFVSDFIDQQRYINRLIMLQDFVTRSSAKGVLAIDEEAIPEGSSPKDFANEWAVFNGVIVYTSKNGNARPPEQIVSSSTQLGVSEMLSIQLKLLEDISGVQGALQGKTPAAGTPAALYAQQVQNSATSLTELFNSFRELREDRDTKILKLIQQYYTEPRYINIAGNTGRATDANVYDPDVVRNAEFDLSIAENAATPGYRLAIHDFLMQLFQMGQITLSELLDNVDHEVFPFVDNLLQAVHAREQESQQAQQAMAQGVPANPGAASPLMTGDMRQRLGANSPVMQKLTGGQPQ
jgi:hypothetical protein